MKRAAPILFAILAGALATAIGMGVFLKLANDDRGRLATEIEQAKQQATLALQDKEKIANDANQKVSAANDEVAKAQHVLEILNQEQRLLAVAVKLEKPSSRDIKNWQSTVSIPLGLSLSIPPLSNVEENDDAALTVVKGATTTASQDTRWLSIAPYDESQETELASSFTTSTDVSYLIQGRLVVGKVGMLTSASSTFGLYRVQQAASSTHLIWMKDPGTLGKGDGFERLLGTFEFAN